MVVSMLRQAQQPQQPQAQPPQQVQGLERLCFGIQQCGIIFIQMFVILILHTIVSFFLLSNLILLKK